MTDELIYSPEVEQGLLAHILRHPAEYTALKDIVTPDMFGWKCFGDVWKAAGSLVDAGMIVDVVTLGDTLEKCGELAGFMLPGSKQSSGRAALGQLREVQTTKGGGESYAVTVQDYYAKRMLDKWLTQAHNWAHNGRPASSIIADLETSMSSLVLHGGKVANHTINAEVAAARADAATEQASRGDRALLTGLPDLDRIIGIQKTDLVTVSARPGQGKTALLCTILVNAAKSGKRGLLFSIEMGATQIAQRLVAQLSGINGYRIMNGKVEESENERYAKALEELSQLPIIICDLPAIRIGQIRTEARKHDVDFIALDYVQLADADKKNDRRDLDIGEVTRGLKALAKERDIPVIMAAQLNRGADARSDKRPTLGDHRESGSIENDSDTIVAIYRPDAYGTNENKRAAELIVLKHRNGPTGTTDAYFDEYIMQFRSAASKSVDVSYPE